MISAHGRTKGSLQVRALILRSFLPWAYCRNGDKRVSARGESGGSSCVCTTHLLKDNTDRKRSEGGNLLSHCVRILNVRVRVFRRCHVDSVDCTHHHHRHREHSERRGQWWLHGVERRCALHKIELNAVSTAHHNLS